MLGRILYLLGGISLGVAGTVLVCKNKESIKPLASKVMSHVLDAKDSVAEHLEVVKENLEDVLANARKEADNRREEASKG